MNKYDEYYIFRLAKPDDIDDIMKFIRDEWRKDHLMGIDKDFFCWQHVNDNRVDFLLVIDKMTNQIEGIMGFNRYSEDKTDLHICGIIAKVRTTAKVPLLGIEMMKRLKLETQYQYFCGIGTNPKTMIPIVKKYFNRYVGVMNHYYRLRDQKEYKIAKVKNKNIIPFDVKSTDVSFVKIDNFEELMAEFDFSQKYNYLPYKSDNYFKKRYFQHPIYHYDIYLLKLKDEKFILVSREENYNNAKMLRYVDFIGNYEMLGMLGAFTQKLIEENYYEFVEFLQCGVDESVMEKSGFIKREDNDENIIPSYFEPFLLENKSVWYEKSHENMILFKGDADQDRPNYRLKKYRR